MNARHEIKIPLHPDQLAGLEEWLELHPAGFFEPYPPRLVNNIYLDTPDRQAYRDNLEGAGRRRKVRLRWYGGERRPDRATLEFKHKANQLGWKTAHQINLAGQPLADLGREALLTVLEAQVGPRAAADLIGLSPALVNRYRRRYFEDAARRLRVTIDDELTFSDPTERHVLGDFVQGHDLVVVELKFDPQDADRIRPLIATLPPRRDKFSKYAVGIQTVGLSG